jgi:hypothetical protein
MEYLASPALSWRFLKPSSEGLPENKAVAACSSRVRGDAERCASTLRCLHVQSHVFALTSSDDCDLHRQEALGCFTTSVRRLWSFYIWAAGRDAITSSLLE